MPNVPGEWHSDRSSQLTCRGVRIAAGKSSRLAQREHLEAVIQHFRDLVGALIAII
jgi:hypothetical protein